VKKIVFVALCFFCLWQPLAFAENTDSDNEKIRVLGDRVQELQRLLENYKNNYAKLETLFWKTFNVADKLLAESGSLKKAAEDFLSQAHDLEKSLDTTVADAHDIISFLKNKTTVRPTALIETGIGYHALLGASATALFVWEPLPWLGFKAGIELWYTDSFRVAVPVELYLRFRLD
jgi:hypothetical protein